MICSSMALIAACRRKLVAGWGINIAIAFALLTLVLLTKNYIDTVGEPREFRRANVGDEAVGDSMTSQDFTRTFSNASLVTGGGGDGGGVGDRDGGGGTVDNADENSVSFSSYESDTESALGSESDGGSSPEAGVLDDSPSVVIIMGQWRFGSSIIGQLFNQNPDVFYLFEPLWLVDQLRKQGRLPPSPFSDQVHDYATDVLRGLSGCQFTDEFATVTNNWGGLINNQVVCQQKTSGCKFPSAQWLSELCLRFQGRIAVKLIRADLENIRRLVVDDKINVKVIHLVRDPRGAAASRIHYYFEFWQDIVQLHTAEFPEKGRLAPIGLNSVEGRAKDCIPTMCQWMRSNLQDPANLADWLRGRYHLLKYEDFAETPVKVAEDLYRFVGMPLPESVRDWVVKNTLTPKSNPGVFDTHKNSKATARHWLSDLSELEIGQVEEHCMDVMQRLGYEPYASLVNDTHHL